MSYTIIVICSACKKVLGTKSGGTTPNEVSHSYCDECAAAQKEETKRISKLLRKEVQNVDLFIALSITAAIITFASYKFMIRASESKAHVYFIGVNMYLILTLFLQKGGDNVAKKQDKETRHCPECKKSKTYKAIGMDCCLGCCGRK